MHRSVRGLLVAGLLAPFLGRAAGAVDSREWELSTVDDFLSGEFDGVILEAPGTLRAGFAHEEIALDAAQVWRVVQDRQGVVYAGTGNEGRVYRIPADGSEPTPTELDGSQVYALAVDEADTVFAASSPDGAIVKLLVDGTAEEWYRPEATYVWDLLVGRDGALYAATGDPAQVLKITGRHEATVLYESTAPHLLTLAEHPDGSLLVGTDQTGVVVALTPGAGARVVYDAPLQEIRSILCATDGTVYFVGVQSQARAASPVASLKLGGLTDEGDRKRNGGNGPDAKKDAPKAPVPARRAGAVASVVYRVDPDGRVAPLWTGQGQRVFTAALLGDELLLGTNQKGTVLRLSPEGVPAVVYRGRAAEVVAAATGPTDQILLGTADMGAVVRLSPEPPDLATYTSAVQDAATQARYGRIRWSVEGDARGPALSVRTGNTREPDADWTPWTGPSRQAGGAHLAVPPGRFLQVRLQWDAADAAAAVTRVNVPFAPRNLAPRVMHIAFQVEGRLASDAVNVGAKSDTTVLQALLKQYANGNAATEAATEEAKHSSGIKVTWKAVDPNGDSLEYTIRFRGLGETLWKELEAEVTATEYEWETTLVPDGWYELQVSASDRPSNAAGEAAEATLVSERVLVDNTGPIVAKLRTTPGRPGGPVQVSGQATDALLPLRRGRYSLDGQPWVWFAAEDGIFDSPAETFTLEWPELAPGEHTLAVQVLDAALNIGSGKQVFTAE